MDNVTLSSGPIRPEEAQERETYFPPAVTYESPLEVRAGTILPGAPDPLDLFGTNES
jgi:hypothetical protein